MPEPAPAAALFYFAGTPAQEGTMDPKRFAELEARLIAEAEEQERLALEALKTGKRWARINYHYDRTYGGKCAVVDVFDGQSGHYSLGLPKQQAHGVVGLINDAHKHLDNLLRAYLDNDPKRAMGYVHELFRTINSTRRAGRPRLALGETRDEQIAAYVKQHGIEATLKRFPNVTNESVARCERRAKKRSGQ
jgi:hypothetical protein